MDVELLVIGDEILSAKREDQHFRKVVYMLKDRGLTLAGAQVVGDDTARIVSAIRRVHRAGDVLLSCGGIGATPDDRTRQAAAEAFDQPILRHPEAVSLIEARYGERAYPYRVQMAEFPRDASLIPNPINDVPGFSYGHCYFVPGFPEMAWPMLEWVLDNRLVNLLHATSAVEYVLRVSGSHVGEGDLLHLMNSVLSQYPGLRLSSLPCRGGHDRVPHVEVGFRGTADAAAAAYEWFAARVKQPGVRVEPIHAPQHGGRC